MRLVYRLSFLLFIVTAITHGVSAQSGEILSNKEIKALEKDGEHFFEKEDYSGAVKYFLQLHEIKPNDPYYNLVIGICYTHDPDQSKNSLPYLEKAKELNPDFDQVDLYLGRAYYKNHEFQRAIDVLNELLNKDESDNQTIDEANELLTYCKNALVITADTVENVRIINMGTVINTDGEEYAPLVLPDESQMIFTYRGVKSTGGKVNDKGEPDEHGRYYEDIFITLKSPDSWMYDEDVWLEPKGLEHINTDLDDASIALSIDGQTMFLYRYTEENGGDIYYSQLNGSTWGEPKPIEGGVNTKYWEGSVSISSDGQDMYFSSDRPGGIGGRDLYSAQKMEDGTWGNVKNLGPLINTTKNDDSPFLHLDRQTLYFSSQGHNSMGGYDVFFSVFENGNWLSPQNMGAPVNTTEDDMFYVANADGTKGYYSSAFGKGSQGKHDIYIVTPDVGRIDLDPVAALIVGTVFANDVPTGSEILIQDVTHNKPGGTFYSNSETGDYRIALLPGAKYKLEVSVENFDVHYDEIDLETLHEYIEVSNNIYIYTQEYAENNKITENKSIEAAMTVPVIPAVVEKDPDIVVAPIPVPKTDPPVVKSTLPCPDIVDLSAFIGKDLNIESNYNNLKTQIGSYCADELEYRVQIGAYRFPQNFKYSHLDKFGNAEVNNFPDGITRFTIGTFTTLNEADALRQQIRTAGTKDAWVIPFFNGERIFMEDLISVNFYKQEIN